jgi:hypothetical protein
MDEKKEVNMSRKERAGVFVELSKAAQDRFNVHHGVEWKIHFGVWTFYVGGAMAFVRLDQDWNSFALLISSTAVAILVFAVYALSWLPHSHQYREECTRTRWWYEMCALDTLLLTKEEKDFAISNELRPRGWPLPWAGDNKWCRRGYVHESQKMAFFATLGLLVISLFCIWGRSLNLIATGDRLTCWIWVAIVLALGAIVWRFHSNCKSGKA